MPGLILFVHPHEFCPCGLSCYRFRRAQYVRGLQSCNSMKRSFARRLATHAPVAGRIDAALCLERSTPRISVSRSVMVHACCRTSSLANDWFPLLVDPGVRCSSRRCPTAARWPLRVALWESLWYVRSTSRSRSPSHAHARCRQAGSHFGPTNNIRRALLPGIRGSAPRCHLRVTCRRIRRHPLSVLCPTRTLHIAMTLDMDFLSIAAYLIGRPKGSRTPRW